MFIVTVLLIIVVIMHGVIFAIDIFRDEILPAGISFLLFLLCSGLVFYLIKVLEVIGNV